MVFLAHDSRCDKKFSFASSLSIKKYTSRSELHLNTFTDTSKMHYSLSITIDSVGLPGLLLEFSGCDRKQRVFSSLSRATRFRS